MLLKKYALIKPLLDEEEINMVEPIYEKAIEFGERMVRHVYEHENNCSLIDLMNSRRSFEEIVIKAVQSQIQNLVR